MAAEGGHRGRGGRRPNVLVTGTPGVGKTELCEKLAGACGLRHVEVGALVRAEGLHEGWDEEFECHVLDEDGVCDALEPVLAAGGAVVDHHGCDWFPERWFDLVVVLRADNGVLHRRLTDRGYSSKKLENNIDCEIMQVVLEEAMESYAKDIVMVLQSDTADDQASNIERIREWLRTGNMGSGAQSGRKRERAGEK